MTESYIQRPSVPSGSGSTAQGSGQLGKGAEGAKNPWVRTGYHKRKRTGKPLILATWNVRTLLDRVEANRPERRTALVTRELKQYNVDIAALSETRFLDKGARELSEVGSGYTIFWSGRKSERKAGVGFAVRTSLVSQLESQPKGINDRIITMRLPLQDNTNATLINVSAPTMTNLDDIKEGFYQQLDVVVRSVPTADRLIILGDLNARIGSNHTAWTGIIGHHGIGQENSNGRLLLSLCSQHSLFVTNTLFKLKDAYKTTCIWMHPRSKHWHQLDFIICRQRDIHDFHITRAMRGAECSTDHLLLRSKVSFQIRRKRRPQRKKPPKKLDVSQTKNPDVVLALQSELSKRLEQVTFCKGVTEENWAKFRD
ncbi:craniofacial development protein 2-like [Acropora muricata]|uniref:craniofacial development protein 2-like n=1 Tax=Acropora muricata TaxID=159855 RepID=UPI0034E5E230